MQLFTQLFLSITLIIVGIQKTKKVTEVTKVMTKIKYSTQ